MSKNLVKTIQSFSFQENLWQKGSRIVVGVSGGPDSVCLLDFWAKMKPKYDLELIIAHVNYGLRGKDSERDEKFVRELAEKYEIKIEISRRGSVSPDHNDQKRSNLSNLKPGFRKFPSENELRDVRYAFFEKVRQENNFDLIAVAHNQDDQAETVLMRLIRGAGLKGLSGMNSKNNLVIRPLLKTSRKEILNYLHANNLKFRTDKTNKTNLFLRNKIRNKLLPILEKEFNPNIKKTLAESAVAIGSDDVFLNKLAEKYYRKDYAASVEKLLSLDPALQRRVLLLAIQAKKGDLENIGLAHIREVFKALKSAKSKNQVVKFQGLKLTRKGDKVILS